MLIQGDTASAFMGALSAFYLKIPIGYVKAGLRSFDKHHPYPEEINRRLISVIGDLHFAPLKSNAEKLRKEGIDPAKIFITGNTVIDALQEIHGRGGTALDQYISPEALSARRLVLVAAHCRESFDEQLADLCHALRELVTRFSDLVVVYPVHLNPNVRQAVLPLLGGHERIHLLEPLSYGDFVEAMSRSYLIITDSGGVQEEAPTMGKPVLEYRKVTERGEGVAANGAKLVGQNRERLLATATLLLEDYNTYLIMTKNRNIYGDGQASLRILQAILHFFDRGKRLEPFSVP